MQIAGIGIINSLTGAGKSSANVNGANFTSLLGSLMGKSAVSQKNDSLQQGTTNLDLNGLIDFLRTDDIFDLKDGKELLNKVLNTENTDLLSTIKDYLGLDNKDLMNVIKNLQSMLSNDSGLNKKSDGMANMKPDDNDLENKIVNNDAASPASREGTSGSKELDDLLACLNQIIALPIQDLPKKITKDFQEIVKTVKLYELLSKNNDGSAKNPQLAENLQQVVQKLETVIGNNKDTSRTDYLQKTFSNVVSEFHLQTESAKEKSPLTMKLDPSSGIVHLQQMSKPEQIMVMSDKSGKPVSTDQLIQQFGDILAKSQFSKTGGTQKLFIKLHPENLGSLRIELTQKDSTIVAKIMTTTGTAKDVLESQLQGLKHAFSSQNIQVDRIEVTQQFSNLEDRSFHSNHQQQQQQREEKSPQEQTNNGEFNQSFEEALLNIEV